MTRDDFRDIMKDVGIPKMSYKHATEAFLEFKGPQLEKSNKTDLLKL